MQAHQCFFHLAFFLATFISVIIFQLTFHFQTFVHVHSPICKLVTRLPTIKKQTQCSPLLHKRISGISSNPTIPYRTSLTLPPDSVRFHIVVKRFAFKLALVFLVRLSCAISYWKAYSYAASWVPPFHTITSAFISSNAQNSINFCQSIGSVPSNPGNSSLG